jgi:hypothetical protein
VLLTSGSNTTIMMGKTLNTELLPSDAGHRKIRATMDVAADDSSMGNAIKSVALVKYIQIESQNNLIAPKTVINGGDVVLVINNRVRLKFNMPPQTSDDLKGTTVFFIRDIQKELAPVMPPSPTPDTSKPSPSPTSSAYPEK